MADDTNEERPFPFLKLPAELRNHIYRALLTCACCGCGNEGYSLMWDQPALLHVNKQIRAEGLPIYYGEGTFYIYIRDSDKGWETFIELKDRFTAGRTGRPGTSNLRYVTSLEVRYGDFFDRWPTGFYMASSGIFPVDTHDNHRCVELEGGDELDLTDMAVVQDALAATVTKAYEPEDMEDMGPHLAKLVQLLWFFGKECPRAARHTRAIFGV